MLGIILQVNSMCYMMHKISQKVFIHLTRTPKLKTLFDSPPSDGRGWGRAIRKNINGAFKFPPHLTSSTAGRGKKQFLNFQLRD